jgi:hypothetical protein
MDYLARLVSTRQKHAEHMQKHRDDHQMSANAMDPAQKPSKADSKVEVLDAPIGPFHRGYVEEHQDHPSDPEDDEQYERDCTQIPGVRELVALERNSVGKPMEQEV